MYITILVSLFFISFAFPPVSGVNSTTATLENNNNHNKNVISSPNATDPLLAPTAEKLIRFRRQPPFTIVKHVSRNTKRSKQRRRTKAPRVKYGPPNYSAGEPLSYYSPHFSSHSSSSDVPSFSFDDFQHLSFDAADLKIPPSSYEAQTMDLEFYHHDSPKTYEPSNIGTYTYGDESEQPLYSYEESTAIREPHKKYGVPQQNDYSTGYNLISDSENHQFSGNPVSIDHYESPDSFVSHNYQPPPQVDYSLKQQHQPYVPPAPQHTVDTQYGPPLNTLKSLPSPANHNNFGVYDKKLPNVGYHQTQHDFAEPPPTQHSSNSNFEITYSQPSYEISSTANTGNNFIQYYPPPSAPHSNSESHPQQPHVTNSQQPHPPHQPQQDYSLPTQELPLNPNHKFPTYDYPKSSYEVPIYDPVPFEASNHEERESYPPEQEGSTDIPPPNEVSNNHEEQFYNPEQSSPSQDAPDTYTSGSAKTTTRGQTTTQQQRKRKRIRGRGNTPTPSSKHILDVPELQKAFESTNQNIHRENINDPDTNESHYIEDKRRYKNPVISTTPPTLIGVHTSETYINHDWSPMRSQTSSTKASFRPTITPTKSTKSTVSSDRYRQRLAQRSRNRSTLSTPSTESYKASTKYVTPNHNSKTRNREKSSTVSIEKSHSKSFYDGTVAPPPANHYQRSTFSSRQNEALGLNPNSEEANSSQSQSTTSVFDTTHFKSPSNDKEVQRKLENLLKQNLPKNHKLF